jgi:hypothetical protein
MKTDVLAKFVIVGVQTNNVPPYVAATFGPNTTCLSQISSSFA